MEITPRNYFPLILTLSLTWILTLLTSRSELDFPKPLITPIEEPVPSTPPTQALVNPAPYLNALIIIGLITASGILVLYIARRKRNFLRLIIGALIWLISFGVTSIYILNLAMAIDFQIFHLWLPLSIFMSSLTTYALLRGGELASSLAASYIASGAGGVLGMSMPYWTFIVLTIGISAYDVLAVYRGHLSTLTREDASLLRGLTIEVGDVVVGMGDLFFYSLTLAAIFWKMGYFPAIVAMIWMIIGYAITLCFLRRRRILPGLPIPLLGALALALVASHLRLGP